MNTSQIFSEALRLSNLNNWHESNLLLDTIPKDESNTIDIHRLYAKNYRHVGEFNQAILYFDQLLALANDDVPAALEKAVCLESIGQNDKALFILNNLAEKHPKNYWVLFAWLSIRTLIESPKTIIQELSHIRESVLNHSEFNELLEQVRARLVALHDLEYLVECDPEDVLELFTSHSEPASTHLRDIYAHFESLGSDCEFGFAQRNAGTEPLGLFRWCGIEPHHLMTVMDTRLEDFDRPEHYTLELQPSSQYFLKDSKYGTVTHTYISTGITTKEALLQKMIQRQTFLKRKLLSEIQIGTKIFVYRFYNDPHDDYVTELVSSLQNAGVKKILICRQADEDYLPGSSRVFSDGVMIGYLSTNYPKTPYQEWDQIVQSAYTYFENE